MANFLMVKQSGSTVDEYANRFRRALLTTGTDVLERLAIVVFMQNLSPQIAHEVRKTSPDSLADAIQVARQVEFS